MRLSGALALAAIGIALASTSGMTAAARPLAEYTVLVVENLGIEKGEKTQDFDEVWLPLLHKGMMRQLEKKQAFVNVVDAGVDGATMPDGKRLVLANTVVEYDKGSRAKRFMIGMGAGAAKMRIRFVFNDAASGQELYRTEREGKYAGWLSGSGGTKEEAVIESAGDVVDRLLEDIKKQR